MVDNSPTVKSMIQLAAIEWLIVLTYLVPFAGMVTTAFDLYVCAGIAAALILVAGIYIVFTKTKTVKAAAGMTVGFILAAVMVGSIMLQMDIFWITGVLLFGSVYFNRLKLLQTSENIELVWRRVFAIECVLFPLFIILCANLGAKAVILPRGVTLVSAAIFVGARLFSLSHIQRLASGARSPLAQIFGIGPALGIMVLWMGLWKAYQVILSWMSTTTSTKGSIPNSAALSTSSVPTPSSYQRPLKPVHQHVASTVHIVVPGWLWLAIGLFIIGFLWSRLKSKSKPGANNVEQMVVSTQRKSIRKAGTLRLLATNSPIRRLYQRFLRHMASSGFAIKPTETPKSYACRLQTSGHLEDDEQWKTHVLQITEAYERVRYDAEHVEEVWEQEVAAELSAIKPRSPHLPSRPGRL